MNSVMQVSQENRVEVTLKLIEFLKQKNRILQRFYGFEKGYIFKLDALFPSFNEDENGNMILPPRKISSTSNGSKFRIERDGGKFEPVVFEEANDELPALCNENTFYFFEDKVIVEYSKNNILEIFEEKEKSFYDVFM